MQSRDVILLNSCSFKITTFFFQVSTNVSLGLETKYLKKKADLDYNLQDIKANQASGLQHKI